MKKIAIVTATRAEYGLLSPVVRALREREDDTFRAELVVTGTHLSPLFGSTVAEIEASGARIDHRVPIGVASGDAADISANQADALVKFTDLFARERYDAVMLLGDRYETLAIAIAAGNTHTPIFHLCGGDTTEGAIDEWIRHSITKMSYLHFVTNEESRGRVIQMGESPDRVFNYGSTSIDNILNVATMGREEALNSIGLPACRYAVCTYHPVTMEALSIDSEMACILNVLRAFPDIEFVFTKANADQGGEYINALLDKAAAVTRNLHVFASLGVRRYLSLVRHSEFVLGNSSSGIIEAPALRVPTINIGNRQKGRLRSESVIDCEMDEAQLVRAVEKAESAAFRQLCREIVSPYGDGHAAGRIAQKAYETVQAGAIDLRKRFYGGCSAR